MNAAPGTTRSERRWTWAGRAADASALVQLAWNAVRLVTAPVLAGVWLASVDSVGLALLAGGVAAAVFGAAYLIWAWKKRGDPYLACDARANRRVTLWLRAGAGVAAAGLVTVGVAVVLLARG
ncbi:hypothetical protein ACQP2E_11455 [Actinoplanes sp. CA-015351]|uniref:hypothetical protein n=1 Tax=Actinoplanes sp. CA-015351 TaxID=3239897 RepID=UPI003D979D29